MALVPLQTVLNINIPSPYDGFFDATRSMAFGEGDSLLGIWNNFFHNITNLLEEDSEEIKKTKDWVLVGSFLQNLGELIQKHLAEIDEQNNIGTWKSLRNCSAFILNPKTNKPFVVSELDYSFDYVQKSLSRIHINAPENENTRYFDVLCLLRIYTYLTSIEIGRIYQFAVAFAN